MQFLSPEQYNQLFTMHGTIMLLFFATPIVFAFANFVVPLQIGAPDVAFPRLNAFAYWLYLFGGIDRGRRLPHAGRRGRLRLVRLHAAVSDAMHSPGVGADMWIVGLVVSGLGTILGARQHDHHDPDLRAPGMTMFRMPIFTWNILVTSLLVLMVVPDPGRRAVRAAGRPASSARTCSTRPPAAPMLWQHLFWFFGHPEVYIVALPFFGIITEVIPVFSRKPMFGYKGLVGATIAIARAVDERVGAPHVRHRPGAAAVLLAS